MKPGYVFYLKPLNQSQHCIGERVPAKIGLVTVEKQEWLVNFVMNQIKRQACWLIVFDVVFFEEHHGSSGSVVKQLIVTKVQHLRGFKIRKNVFRELV